MIDNVFDDLLSQDEGSFDKSFNLLDDLKENLDSFLEKDLKIEDIEDPKEMSQEQANYFVKKYNDFEKEKQDIVNLCKAEEERILKGIKMFKESNIEKIEKQQEYFATILKQFLLSELSKKKTSSKSIKLPYGTLSLKKQQPSYTYDDELAIKFFEENNSEYVNEKITKTLDKTLIKRGLNVVGNSVMYDDVAVPGIVVEEKEPKFEIKSTK